MIWWRLRRLSTIPVAGIMILFAAWGGGGVGRLRGRAGAYVRFKMCLEPASGYDNFGKEPTPLVPSRHFARTATNKSGKPHWTMEDVVTAYLEECECGAAR